MASLEYSIFDTQIGRCGLAWEKDGIVAVQLPESTDEKTVARLVAEREAIVSAKPPKFAREAIDRLTAHLSGRPDDLASVPVVFAPMTPFRRRIYEELRRVAPGRTVTYGELAEAAGKAGAARAVGQAMAKNRLPIIVPCHRVLGSGGALHGFSAAGGLVTKEKLLALEGVAVGRTSKLDVPFDRKLAVRLLSHADAKLAALIERVGPFTMPLEEMTSPYEALAESIVHQQLNPKAARTIANRIKAAFGGTSYPAPELLLGTADEVLRGAGLSTNKLKAFRDLAEKTVSGALPTREALDRMGDEEIIERLTVVRGIGAWTVQMVLIFRLGRPDVMALDDFGLRAGFGKWFLRGRHATKDELARRSEKWRPFRSVASWYLWRANEL